jgi:hypothetical protein
MYHSMHKFFQLLFLASFAFSCSRKDYLDTKPDQSLAVPSTIADYQALLDNDQLNGAGGYPASGLVPGLGEIGADNYFVLEADYTAHLQQADKNKYTWQSNPYPGVALPDWNMPYADILYMNVVLDGLSKLKPTIDQQAAWNNCRGSALFFRAFCNYQLAQLFAAAYDATTASKDLGIPLRITSDVNEKIVRSTNQETYDVIISELKEAIRLLPDNPVYKTRPSRPATYGLLSRVFLSMQNYDQAYLYADSCLKMQNSLLNYSSFSTTALFPFARFNAEVLWNCTLLRPDPLMPAYCKVDTGLYNSYNANDLRKVLYYKAFNGYFRFLGSYDGSAFAFGGIAVDEVYLTRAECAARKNDMATAINDLNTLLKTRWKTGTFIPFVAGTAGQALDVVLSERRKELIMRGTRWTDLRRLNKESNYAKALMRKVQGQQYTLPFADPRYTWLIPDNVISFHPDMQQNPR